MDWASNNLQKLISHKPKLPTNIKDSIFCL